MPENRLIKKILFIIIILGFIVYSLYFAGAAVFVGKPQDFIKTSYNSGDKITGGINISLSGQKLNSILSDNFGNTISLYNLLKNKLKSNYSCMPINCGAGYNADDGGSDMKTLSISNNKIIGLKISGKNVQIGRVSFKVSSDAGASCSEQLSIDINDDGTNDWVNDKILSQQCGFDVKSSCYSTFPEWFLITQIPYCEKIKLSQAPAFDLKAYIKMDSGATPDFSSGLLKASIYDSNKFIVGICDLTKPTVSGGYVSCTVNYASKASGDYYVCVSSKESSDLTGYKLQGKLNSNCGFQGDPGQTSDFTADYNIVASAKKFDSVGSFVVNDTTFYGQNAEHLTEYMNNYLNENYQDDCSASCIIPIKLSGISQSATISDVNLEYTSQSGTLSSSKIYSVSKTDAVISSNYTIIDLTPAEFHIYGDDSNKTWILYLDGSKILNKSISFNSVSGLRLRQVYPRIVAASNPTVFFALFSVNTTYSNYSFSWNFGDGSADEPTDANRVEHTYDSIGNYTMQIGLIDKNGNKVSTSAFSINVESPKNAINSTLADYKAKISNVESQINALPKNYQTIIKNDFVDINSLKADLSAIEQDYKQKAASSGSSTGDYIEIMKQLVNMKIPYSVEPSKTSSLDFVFDKDSINLAAMRDMFNEDYTSSMEDQYKNEILKWYISNMDVNADVKTYSVYYKNSVEDIVTEFTFNIKPKKQIDYPVYFIIQEAKDKIISDNIGSFKDGGDASGIALDMKNAETIKFAVKGNVDLFEQPIFIAPKLSTINISSAGFSAKSGNFWLRLFGGMFALLIIALGIYIFIQEWYKKNYESHLFKDKNQLYNLIYFISNAKKQGIKNDEIKKRLLARKWKSEQITYAINKFEGKRVGMWEIPVFAFREKKKVKEEIRKREAGKFVY